MQTAATEQDEFVDEEFEAFSDAEGAQIQQLGYDFMLKMFSGFEEDKLMAAVHANTLVRYPYAVSPHLQ